MVELKFRYFFFTTPKCSIYFYMYSLPFSLPIIIACKYSHNKNFIVFQKKKIKTVFVGHPHRFLLPLISP